MLPTGIERLEWAARAAKVRRDHQFVEITDEIEGVKRPAWVFSSGTRVGAVIDERQDAWCSLPYQPNILRPLGTRRNEVLLEYAALDWGQSRLDLTLEVHQRTAFQWLHQLIDVHEHIGHHAALRLKAFANPVVKIDLGGHVRVAFSSEFPDDLPSAHELRLGSRAWSDRTLVFMVGHALLPMVAPGKSARIEELITRCLEEKPRARFRSLAALRREANNYYEPTIRTPDEYRAFKNLEEGLGWLELGKPGRAIKAFELALYVPAARKRAEEACEFARAELALAAERQPPPQPLKSEPPSFDQFERRCRAGQFVDALAVADALLARWRTAAAHYARGKALFLLWRLHESRTEFETAFSMDPRMLEAMLLRREVDRAIGGVRTNVGDATPVKLAIPPTLLALRDELLSGDAKRTIAALEDARYAADPDAQLVLARYLAMDGQHERALDVYDRITSDAHRSTALLGKASTLLDLDRDESALAIYDQLVAERPSDAEASEGRARALETLGRIGEAAAEYRRFISLATAGSDLRVRAAQEWLDTHPL